MRDPAADVRFHPLEAGRWDDFQRLMRTSRTCASCWCMWWRMTRRDFHQASGESRYEAMRGRVASGDVPGILAYLDNEPIGWCSVAPRESFPGIQGSPSLRPRDDRPAWAITCFYVAPGWRRRGVMRALLDAAVEHARAGGATLVEGYPVERRDDRMPSVDAYTGLVPVFEEAGFVPLVRATPRRWVMRRAVDADPGARQVLEAYCDAWNRWDLDALFALFADDAVYRGTHRLLEGRDAIRRMYEASRARGRTSDLLARVVPLVSGTWGVGLYRRGGQGGHQLVALKHVAVRAGRILAHDLVEGEAASREIARKQDSGASSGRKPGGASTSRPRRASRSTGRSGSR